jgi:hypothetical protein
MIRESSQPLAYAMPALASLAVVCAAWWTAPRRAALRPGGTAANPIVRLIGRRWIPAVLVAVIGATLGVLAYLGHAPGLSSGRAIGGAVVALVASSLPLSLYWAMGRFVRDMVALVVAWLASLVLLYYYALIAALIVVGYTQCGPGSSSCPLG